MNHFALKKLKVRRLKNFQREDFEAHCMALQEIISPSYVKFAIHKFGDGPEKLITYECVWREKAILRVYLPFPLPDCAFYGTI